MINPAYSGSQSGGSSGSGGVVPKVGDIVTTFATELTAGGVTAKLTPLASLANTIVAKTVNEALYDVLPYPSTMLAPSAIGGGEVDVTVGLETFQVVDPSGSVALAYLNKSSGKAGKCSLNGNVVGLTPESGLAPFACVDFARTGAVMTCTNDSSWPRKTFGFTSGNNIAGEDMVFSLTVPADPSGGVVSTVIAANGGVGDDPTSVEILLGWYCSNGSKVAWLARDRFSKNLILHYRDTDNGGVRRILLLNVIPWSAVNEVTNGHTALAMAMSTDSVYIVIIGYGLIRLRLSYILGFSATDIVAAPAGDPEFNPVALPFLGDYTIAGPTPPPSIFGMGIDGYTNELMIVTAAGFHRCRVWDYAQPSKYATAPYPDLELLLPWGATPKWITSRGCVIALQDRVLYAAYPINPEGAPVISEIFPAGFSNLQGVCVSRTYGSSPWEGVLGYAQVTGGDYGLFAVGYLGGNTKPFPAVTGLQPFDKIVTSVSTQ